MLDFFEKRITNRTHIFLQNFIQEDFVCIDATVGNGYDTEFLVKNCGIKGKVIGFDIQKAAIESTTNTLKELFGDDFEKMNLEFRLESHVKIGELKCNPDLIMFNLGYLPGANKHITTMVDSTLDALEGSLKILKKGGILSLMSYPGHEEGSNEEEAVHNFVSKLDHRAYEVVKMIIPNKSEKTPKQYYVYKKH